MRFRLPKLNIFKKKKEEPPPETYPTEETLPEDLEKFRAEREEATRAQFPTPAPTEPTPAEVPPGGYPSMAEPAGPTEAPFPAVETTPRIEVRPEPKPETTMPKEDLILQKLDTIDTRLKLIEEKMK